MSIDWTSFALGAFWMLVCLVTLARWIDRWMDE